MPNWSLSDRISPPSAQVMAGGGQPAALLPCCDGATPVLFTIHVGERAVACAVARDALAGPGNGISGKRVGAGLAGFRTLRATMALLGRDSLAHE
jgi:hypothetical protein